MERMAECIRAMYKKVKIKKNEPDKRNKKA